MEENHWEDQTRIVILYIITIRGKVFGLLDYIFFHSSASTGRQLHPCISIIVISSSKSSIHLLRGLHRNLWPTSSHSKTLSNSTILHSHHMFKPCNYSPPLDKSNLFYTLLYHLLMNDSLEPCIFSGPKIILTILKSRIPSIIPLLFVVVQVSHPEVKTGLMI